MRKPQDLPLFRAAAAEIKARRADLQISQEELAHRAGLNRSFIGKLEVASTQPSMSGLFKLAIALEVDVAELVGRIAVRLARERRRAKKDA
jgi:transcriptional regulator with XRE-family HTH domain